MEVEIPGKNLRVFGRALACLGKLGGGGAVFFEARAGSRAITTTTATISSGGGDEGGKLILRALNPSRSAFAGITFHRAFFDSFRVASEPPQSPSSPSSVSSSSSSSVGACKFQVHVKALSGLFKPSGLAHADRCTISADPGAARMTCVM
jgi:hypothetical protein